MNRMTTGSASETKHTNQGVSVLREHHMSIRLTSVTTSGAKTAVPRGICNAKTPSGCRFKPTTFGKFVKLCNANIIDATAIGIDSHSFLNAFNYCQAIISTLPIAWSTFLAFMTIGSAFSQKTFHFNITLSQKRIRHLLWSFYYHITFSFRLQDAVMRKVVRLFLVSVRFITHIMLYPMVIQTKNRRKQT